MTELVASDAFEARVETLLEMVHKDHKEAFRFIFELGKGMLDVESSQYMGMITALALNDSVRRVAAEDAKKSKILRV